MRQPFLGFLLSASFLGLAAAPAAFAADLPLKAPRAVVEVDPWSGWYLGLHAGGAQERSCNDYTRQGLIDPLNTTPVDDAFLASISVGCSNNIGFIGGGQLGVNQKMGQFVFGLEGDISGLTTKTSRFMTGVSPFGGNPFNGTQNVTLNGLATVGPRLGVLVTPNTLAYAMGGLAMGHVSASGGQTSAGGFQGFGSATGWTPGWMAGAGVETKIGGGPWSIKGEYVFARLSKIAYDTTQPAANVNNGFAQFSGNIGATNDVQILRLGVNYKMGSPVRSAYASMGAPVYSWAGFYAGASAGGAWGTSRATDVDNFNATGDTFKSRTTGPTGSGQLGYNWQMSSMVYGLEGEFGYLGFRGMQRSSLFTGETYVTSTGGAFGTFRGKIGYAVDRALLYATGGLMVADVAASVITPAAFVLGDGIQFSGKTNAQAGWTLGGGAEYALRDGWSVKGEYLHFDLGSKRVSGPCVNCPGPPAQPVFGWDVKNIGDLVRLGVNYQLSTAR